MTEGASKIIKRKVMQPAGLMPQFRLNGKTFFMLGGYDPDVFGWEVSVHCDRFGCPLTVDADGVTFHIQEVTK